MIKVTLPDGSVKEVEKGTSPLAIAKSISEGLARKVLAAEVNGETWDLTRSLDTDSSLKLLSFQDDEGKATLWHSSAHLMAEALEFYYPGIKLAMCRRLALTRMSIIFSWSTFSALTNAALIIKSPIHAGAIMRIFLLGIFYFLSKKLKYEDTPSSNSVGLILYPIFLRLDISASVKA